MSNFVNLQMDLTAPASPSIIIASGAIYTASDIVNTAIQTSDSDTSGYQMKLWGDVDTTYNANIQTLEASSSWISYSSTQQVKLSSGDSTKVLYLRIRDDVFNPSSQASDSITLDTALPLLTTTSVDVSVISKQASRDTAAFSFSSDVDFTEYKIKLVSSTSSLENSGTLMLTTFGSSNVSGTGTFPSGTPINVIIKGGDFEVAGAVEKPSTNILKVFVKDSNNNLWSV